MSTCTWLNLAVGISIFSTEVLGCLVTLAQLQAAHSLHQATTSDAKPGTTKRAATSHCVAHRPVWESSCTCWMMARRCVTGTSGLMAPVEVSHHSSLLAGQLVSRQLLPPDGSLLRGRDHRRRHCRGRCLHCGTIRCRGDHRQRRGCCHDSCPHCYR